MRRRGFAGTAGSARLAPGAGFAATLERAWRRTGRAGDHGLACRPGGVAGLQAMWHVPVWLSLWLYFFFGCAGAALLGATEFFLSRRPDGAALDVTRRGRGACCY